MSDLLDQVAAVLESAPLMQIPARNLSESDAFKLMMDLVELEQITLFDKIVRDKSGKITSHKPGMQTKIIPEIAGIPFLKASGTNNGNNGSAGATQQKYFAPTPSFAIVLFKLAVMLRDDWQATQVVYGGIGAGGSPGVTDCHMTGRCMDFYGADTNKGTFDVRKDWWLRPVYDSAGNLHPSEGNGWGVDRWKDETKTWYRLATSPKPEDANAADFFAAIYEFAHEQARAEAFDINPHEFSAGSLLKMGWIIHPDYPRKLGKGGREKHNDHMHFQLGNT
ncbi:MAG TPA: hypothetical protein VKV39_17805 [Candidatus Sulfotelmatobacter sp.]|nr:hypothetical protein [Candidatus Sulfotelmatobacter sp.]